MILTIILTILVALTLLILGWILWRRLPQLRLLDPGTSHETKAKRLKNELVRQRFERASVKKLRALQLAIFRPMGRGMQDAFRRFAGKLTAVERRYQDQQKKEAAGGMTNELKREMIDEGKRFMDEELWDRAEKKFIEVIGADPKYADAYEQLGRLYLYKKDYPLAKETFEFLAKLQNKNASVIASIGEVEMLLGNPARAFRHFARAVKISPKNPKYLDFLVTAAIASGDKYEALRSLDALAEVNPENAKIADFQQEIEEMKTHPE